MRPPSPLQPKKSKQIKKHNLSIFLFSPLISSAAEQELKKKYKNRVIYLVSIGFNSYALPQANKR